MREFPSLPKVTFQRVTLMPFAILILFWFATVFNCMFGYVESGSAGLHTALLHQSKIYANPNEWGHPG